MKQKYSVVGLGKLGASLTAVIAEQGFEVIGVDTNARSVDAVNAGRAPVEETDLAPTLTRNLSRISATQSHAEAITGSNVTFVTVPTPSDDDGAFILDYAIDAMQAIGAALKRKKDYHLVVLVSTVLPGASRHGLMPPLELMSGKRVGEDFGFCYSPAFIALGEIIENFKRPDLLLIGESDARAGDLLEASYRDILSCTPPCKRMTLENAELAKISVNTFVTTKITFANMLADLCERIPGGDVDIVSDAIGMDKRIGRRYLTGGLGYGGPCFPRDNIALSYFARAVGTRADLAETTDRLNRRIPDNFAQRTDLQIAAGAKVAVLGLAYKPKSHWTEESQGLALAQSWAASGANVVAYDPLANGMAHEALGDSVTLVESVSECLAGAALVLVTTPDGEFSELSEADFAGSGGDVIVVDFWRMLESKLSGRPGIRYIAVGRSRDDTENDARLQDLWQSSGQALAAASNS